MTTQFSQDGRYFARLTIQGRVAVWETSDKSPLVQELDPDEHLTSSSRCTCLQFIERGRRAAPLDNSKGNTPKKKRRRTASPPGGTTVQLALGSTSGEILIYSLEKSSPDFILHDTTHEIGAVSCLAWSPEGATRLYSTSHTDSGTRVTCWNLVKRSVESRWNVKDEDDEEEDVGNDDFQDVLSVLSDGEKILTGSGHDLVLWDASSGKRIGESLNVERAHSYELVALSAVGERYAVSGSRSDRMLGLWKFGKDEEVEEDSVDEPLAILKLETAPVVKISSVIVDDEKKMFVLAILTDGSMRVFKCTPGRTYSNPIRPYSVVSIKIRPASDITDNPIFQIIDVYLDETSTPTVACIDRRSNKMSFTRLTTVANLKRLNPIFKTIDGVPCKKHTKSKDSTVDSTLLEDDFSNITLENGVKKGKVNGVVKKPFKNKLAWIIAQALVDRDDETLQNLLKEDVDDEEVLKAGCRGLSDEHAELFAVELIELMGSENELISRHSHIWLRRLLLTRHADLASCSDSIRLRLSHVLGAYERSAYALVKPIYGLKARVDALSTHFETVISTDTSGAPMICNGDYAARMSSGSDSNLEDIDVLMSYNRQRHDNESDYEWSESDADEQMELECSDSDVSLEPGSSDETDEN